MNESNGLIQHGSAGVAEYRKPATVLEIIADAAMNPNVDVAKMAALLQMKATIDVRDAELAYNQAMARLQPKLPRIAKNGKIRLVKDGVDKGSVPFAKFEDIDRVLRPMLAEEGLSVSFSSLPVPSGVVMTCTISHVLGHSEKSQMQLPPDKGPGRNDLQAIGSARSYAKRYLVTDMLNIITVGQDDDGLKACWVSQEQADTIWTMIVDCGMDKDKGSMDRFLAYMMANRFNEIQARDFKKATTALQAQIRKTEKDKANGNLSSN